MKKITKRSHAFKGYATSYNVETLLNLMNYFNTELQLQDTESAIKNKLIHCLSELKDFKFMTTLVLEFKKIQSDDKIPFSTFYSNSKAETIINESYIDDNLDQSIALLYQIFKTF